MRGLGFATLMLAACGSEELVLSFQVPDAYASVVSQLSVSVLEPAGGDWTCEQLSFGERSQEEIRVAQSARVTFSYGTPIPDGLDIAREGTRLVMVEGVSEEGVPIVRGCSLVDQTVDRRLSVSVDTSPVVSVALPAEASIYAGDISGPTPAALPVAVFDWANNPAPAIALKRRFTPLSLVAAESLLTSGDDGRVMLDLEGLPELGPNKVEVIAAWGTEPAEFVSFDVPRLSGSLSPPGSVSSVIAVQLEPEGPDTLFFATGFATEPTNVYAAGIRADGTPERTSLATDAIYGRLTVIDNRPFAPRTDLEGGYYLDELDASSVVDDPIELESPDDCVGCVLRRVVDASDCVSGASLVVAATFRAGSIEQSHLYSMTTGLKLESTFAPSMRPVAFACLEFEGALRQFALFEMDVDDGCPEADASSGDESCERLFMLPELDEVTANGLRTPRILSGPEGDTLLGTVSSSAGVSIVSADVVNGPNGPILDTTPIVDVVGNPSSFVLAQLNEEPEIDFVSLVSDALKPAESRLVVQTESASQSLAGVSARLTDQGEGAQLTAADLDGDGIDELVLSDGEAAIQIFRFR